MKKIFTFALVAFAGSLAGNAQYSIGEKSQISESSIAEIEALAVENTSIYKAPAAAPSTGSVAGTYTWYYKSGLAGANGNGNTGTVVVSEDSSTSNGVLVKLTVNESVYFTVPGTLDSEKGTISINKTNLGKDSDGDSMVFEWFDWTGDAPAPQDTPVVLTIQDKRLVTAPGLVWGVGSHSSTDNKVLGYYLLTYNNFIWGDFTWEEVATDVSYTDNFFSPMFGKAGQSTTLTVYEAKEAPGIYKFNNFFGVMGSTYPACLMDCTNPDRVYVPVQSSGIKATGRGNTWYANVAALTSSPTATLTYPNKPTQSTNMTCVNNEGEITINMPAGACRFNWDDYSAGVGSWYYNSSTADTKIVFKRKSSGIETVTTDEYAPVEYYTLQGVKVVNPTSGTIVIRRQGATVSKILVK